MKIVKIVTKDNIIRITAGGQDKDFPASEFEEAMDYIRKISKQWKYVAMRIMSTFERVEEDI